MIVLKLPASSDNLTYILASGEGRECAVIDPVDTDDIIKAIRQAGLGKVSAIFNTHGHPDHTSGNVWLKERTGARLFARDPDRRHIPGDAKAVTDEQTISIDGLDMKILSTPGHTMGSICLFVQPDGESPHLFSGDTVFLAGCGNTRFGGNPETLYESFRTKILPLPPETRLHPGHDYAINNLRFALSVEPGNRAARDKLDLACSVQKSSAVPGSTLGEEREYNPFFRLDSAEIRSELGKRFSRDFDDDKSVFLALRELRNRW